MKTSRLIFRGFLLLIASTLLGVSGCHDDGPTGTDSVRLGEPFRLSVGETADVRGEPLRLRFERVRQDSRCPSDLVCITAGEVEIELLAATSGPLREIVLATVSRPETTFEGYSIRLLRAAPERGRSDDRIDPRRYRVEMEVRR